MEILGLILFPIVWVMKHFLLLFLWLTGSMGLSIILVGFTFSLMLILPRSWGEKMEQQLARKLQEIEHELQPFKRDLKGEALFLETERIYEAHNYHPIHNIAMGASILVMLPVLLSAIILFSGEGLLSGESFLVLSDLSQPDGLLGPFNLLPILMLAVTVIDAQLRFAANKKNRNRFLVISAILLILVYNLAAGLVLYWTASNFMSLLVSRLNTANP